MKSKHNHLVMELDHMEKLYTSPNPLERWYFNERLRQSLQLAKFQNGERVLDAGCGEGQFLRYIETYHPKTKRWGVDVTDVALSKAKSKTHSQIIKQELSDLSKLKSDFFDVTFCLDVIEHVKDYQDSLNELKRVTKKKGKLILAFPNDFINMIYRIAMFKWPPRVPDHINQFTPKKMQKLLRLEIIDVRTLPLSLPFSLSLWCVCAFRNR